jgi:hypothetical protein
MTTITEPGPPIGRHPGAAVPALPGRPATRGRLRVTLDELRAELEARMDPAQMERGAQERAQRRRDRQAAALADAP